MHANPIDHKIRSLRGVLRKLILVAALSRILLVALGFTALCLLTDWTFHLSPGWRLAFLGVGAGGVLLAIHRFLLRPIFVPMPDDQLALLFERRFPELQNLLVSAVQLAADRGAASPELVEAVLKDAERASQDVDPTKVPQRRKISRLALVAVAALAAATSFCIASPDTVAIFVARFLDPFGPHEWPRSTELVIEVDGQRGPEIAVPRGEQITVRVIARNARNSALWRPPSTASLDYQQGSASVRSMRMRRVADETFEAYFNDVTERLVISARAGDASAGPVEVRIVELPYVEDIWLSLEYPTYTGLAASPPSRSTTELAALAGTQVKVEIKSSKPLRPDGASIELDAGSPVPMRALADDGTRGLTHEGRFTLAPSMRWFRVRLTDLTGNTNRSPRTFQLRVIEDKPPRIKLVKPGTHTRCTPHAEVPLEVDVRDDLAVRSTWLRYVLDPKSEPKTVPLELGSSRPAEARIAYRWDISKLGLKVGQTVSYRAEADDFCDVFPADAGQIRQIGQSEDYFIRIVSPAELASELDQRLFALRNELKKARRGQEQNRRQVGELLRKTAEGQPLTNDDRTAAADAENTQRELGRAVSRIAEGVETVREQMEDNRIGSFADRRRLEDVRKVLAQLAVTEMPRAADFVKDARKELASRDGRDALLAASGIQARIIQQIDRVLSMMTHNEDTEKLIRAARALLQAQQAVKTETSEFARRPGAFGAAPSELAPQDHAALNLLTRRQNAATDDMRNLEQDMLDVFERLKESDPKQAELVRHAQSQAGRDQIRPMMEESAAKLAANQIGLAASHQQTAIEGLERLLATLESAREQFSGDAALAQAIRDVRNALEDVRRLRKHQEGHVSDTAEINKDAEQAKALKQLLRTIARLRTEQDKVNADAREALSNELAERQDRIADEADRLTKEIAKEATEAAAREAPQAGDIAAASKAAGDAKSQMNASANGMRQNGRDSAMRSGADAGRSLAEAADRIARALEDIEKRRLTDTKEIALKQRETANNAEDVFRKLKQLSKETEESSADAAKGLDSAGDAVGQAGQSMRSAQSSLDKNDTVKGEQEATDARDRLADAQQLLEKLRDDLEKQQKEQKLLDLIVELQPVLEKQLEINDETRRIDATLAQNDPPEPSRPDQVRLSQLASDEGTLATRIGDLLKKVEGENAPVFLWGFRKIVADMNQVKQLLGSFRTDAYTQDVEKDIADTLAMLIDALKREQSKMREEGESGSGGGSGGGRPMLVPPSAQLKLLKARELELHNKTKRLELARLLKPEHGLTALQKKQVERLAVEQNELAELTAKLAEALEQEVREHRQRLQKRP